ncbi:LysR family transcriptional regulator [Pseudoduganella plicata]|uniref:LysR family transcriptional regulator n=1 Tax=Pseudoduganella plicata TaxID=321984 RepID=A0ABX5S5A6_9BURK|nr:LysR family transcriptional regulator [Pseudoduganella plicata]
MTKLPIVPRSSAPLRGADLPLLISLNVLLEECNVTRAAMRLHLSQPALSAQLSRLRLLFGDPLLVPAESGRGLAPSPFALKLHRRLQPALLALTTAVRPATDDFDPARAARIFTLAANNTATAVVLPGLAGRLQAQGNRQLQLRLASPDEPDLASRLERGEVDLCFSAACLLPPGLMSCELVTAPYVLVQRAGHARGRAPMTLDDYRMLDHVNVARDGSLHGAMDEQLYRLGHTRHTVVAVQDFTAVGRSWRRATWSALSRPSWGRRCRPASTSSSWPSRSSRTRCAWPGTRRATTTRACSGCAPRCRPSWRTEDWPPAWPDGRAARAMRRPRLLEARAQPFKAAPQPALCRPQRHSQVLRHLRMRHVAPEGQRDGLAVRRRQPHQRPFQLCQPGGVGARIHLRVGFR